MFRTRRSRSAGSCRTVRLMLETLEQRLTPSGGNPTVTQTASSYNALTAAIGADTSANTNYVIQITSNFTFNSGGQVAISKLGSGSTLTIEGQNGVNYALTGNGNRLFSVASGQNVTFADLTLRGGSVVNNKGTAQGGAILDQGGNVTLSKMTVQGNTVEGGTAEGGGVYISGAGTAVIRDSLLIDNTAQGSQGADGTAPGMNGSGGGAAYGGGLYVGGSGWTVTLTGDTLSGNTARGGNGGSGAAGTNATTANTSGGNGGSGGAGGSASGGAAYFSVRNNGNGNLTILNNLSAPISDPSTMMDNSAQAGTGGNGGAGGKSTGTAIDSFGGGGGLGGEAAGGAVDVSSASDANLIVNIGNSAFYANKAAAGNDGQVGAFGTGGIFIPPPQPPLRSGPFGPTAVGGGLAFGDGNITMVNSTVAKNAVINTAVPSSLGGAAPSQTPGPAWGGGIYDKDAGSLTLDNNTITQNTLQGGNTQYAPSITGAGVYVASGNPTLVNNLILGNQNLGSSASDLASNGTMLSSASNNFLGNISANTVSTTANIVRNTQAQLGSAVGVTVNGTPAGGPIYYPLLSGVASIGSGTTSVLATIASVEKTPLTNVTDEIGNRISSNGPLDLGAVQLPTSPSPPPSSSPLPPSTSALSPFQLMAAIILDFEALTHQDVPPTLLLLDAISEQLLGQSLPSAANLIPDIEGDIAALVNFFIGATGR